MSATACKTLAVSLALVALLLAACQPAPGGEFAIYLLEQPLTAAQADAQGLQNVTLQRQPLVGSTDLLSYTQATHAMILTEAAKERIRQLKVPVSGLPFVVCVGAERIYAGAFWTSISSLSYDGVIINVLPWEAPEPLKIELGYPGQGFFARKDPRADARILEALRAAGKLK